LSYRIGTALEQVDCNPRILFRLELTLKDSSRTNVWHFSGYQEFQRLTKTRGGMNLAPLMFGEAPIQVPGRPDVMTP